MAHRGFAVRRSSGVTRLAVVADHHDCPTPRDIRFIAYVVAAACFASDAFWIAPDVLLADASAIN